MNLLEGLRANDLEGLVLPVISIDQFESKIDDDAIVVAFYVEYKDPATDLNRFIQKSAEDLLDTEVSPAPTEEGYYLVFVELARSDKFPKTLLGILDDLKNLVALKQWRFIGYGKEGVHDLTEENILAMVRLQPNKSEPQEETITEFLRPSDLDDIAINGNLLTLQRNQLSETYQMIAFGRDDELAHLKEFTEGLRVGSDRQRQRVEALLGASWLVEMLQHDCMSLSNSHDNRLMIVKRLS